MFPIMLRPNLRSKFCIVAAATMVAACACIHARAARTIINETFDDDVSGPFTAVMGEAAVPLPNTMDNYSRSSVSPSGVVDPATGGVTGTIFADPFGVPGNKSLVLHNPNSTTQMALAWIDEFEDDPTTFRNGTIDFDLYMESPDLQSVWTFLGVRIGHGGPDRQSITTSNGADVTIWNSFRFDRTPFERDPPLEQVVDDGYRFVAGTGSIKYQDDLNPADLLGPDRKFHVRYEIDGSGTTFEDPPTYRLLVESTPIGWSDGETDHFWVINQTSAQLAPGINIMSFLTDASARSKIQAPIGTGQYSTGIGDVFIDNLVVVNNDLPPLPDGDVDDDGDVDGTDFLIIQRTDPDLIPTWAQEFGSATAAAAGVPEPGGLLLVSTSLAAAALAGRNRRPRQNAVRANRGA